MQMSDNKVAAMKYEINKKIGAAKFELQAASADSRTNVLDKRLTFYFLFMISLMKKELAIKVAVR